MTPEYLALTILISLSILIPIFVVCIIQGKKKCDNNDAIGVILLFIPLNIFGIMYGLALLYNVRNNKKDITSFSVTKENEIEKN